MLPGHRSGLANKDPSILKLGPKCVSVYEEVVILRHRPRQKIPSHLVVPKGDCWSESPCWMGLPVPGKGSEVC